MTFDIQANSHTNNNNNNENILRSVLLDSIFLSLFILDINQYREKGFLLYAYVSYI